MMMDQIVQLRQRFDLFSFVFLFDEIVYNSIYQERGDLLINARNFSRYFSCQVDISDW